MLQKLAYLNIFFALVYLLAYLKSGTFNSTAGIFVIILFNWLSLRSYEKEEYKWGIWHYLTGVWSVYFVGTIMYGAVNIVSSAMEYEFITNDTLVFLALSIVFSVAVLLQFVIYSITNYKALKN